MSIPDIAGSHCGIDTIDLKPTHVHLVGICGAGMKPLAHALLSMGVPVSGSDPSAAKGKDLRAKGVALFSQHEAANIGVADVVVYSSAIAESNPELAEARRRGVRILHRSEMLGWFLARKESVLVAGTHGKTTTTAMLTIIMDEGGFDPWGFVGGGVQRYGGNLRIGKGRFAVAEADESDGTFLNLPRDNAIITNIEAEHLNFWKTEDQMFDGFARFIERVPEGGQVVVCQDDPGIARLLRETGAQPVTYSVGNAAANFYARIVSATGEYSVFDLYRGDEQLIRITLGVPGLHNVANATGACAMALRLGADMTALARALADFRGADRRFTLRTAPEGYMVIDDYGHHPTEIAATMKAARMRADDRGGRLHVVLQPHRYTRTEAFFDRFAVSLEGADNIIVTDIYAAGEPPIPGISGEELAKHIATETAVPTRHISSFETIIKIVRESIKIDDIVLLLGAGTVTTLADLLCTPDDTRSRDSGG